MSTDVASEVTVCTVEDPSISKIVLQDHSYSKNVSASCFSPVDNLLGHRPQKQLLSLIKDPQQLQALAAARDVDYKYFENIGKDINYDFSQTPVRSRISTASSEKEKALWPSARVRTDRLEQARFSELSMVLQLPELPDELPREDDGELTDPYAHDELPLEVIAAPHTHLAGKKKKKKKRDKLLRRLKKLARADARADTANHCGKSKKKKKKDKERNREKSLAIDRGDLPEVGAIVLSHENKTLKHTSMISRRQSNGTGSRKSNGASQEVIPTRNSLRPDKSAVSTSRVSNKSSNHTPLGNKSNRRSHEESKSKTNPTQKHSTRSSVGSDARPRRSKR